MAFVQLDGRLCPLEGALPANSLRQTREGSGNPTSRSRLRPRGRILDICEKAILGIGTVGDLIAGERRYQRVAGLRTQHPQGLMEACNRPVRAVLPLRSRREWDPVDDPKIDV